MPALDARLCGVEMVAINCPGFHVGIWAGGLILGGVQNAFPDNDQIAYDKQYSVFIALCLLSVITFLIHAYTFRKRYRNLPPKETVAPLAGQQPDLHVTAEGRVLHRIQNDDGTVEFREVSREDIKSEFGVVSDLALTGGRADPKAKYTWATFKKRFFQPLQMLWHPVFGPLGPAIFISGGMTQGWWNASFNQVVAVAGNGWNGWIYAIAESFAIVASIVFGLFYDKLRKKYEAHKFRWIMYVYVVAYYLLCAAALGAYYMSLNGVGDLPGQTKPVYFYLILTLVGALYNIQLLALEVSILTYLSTFLTYNADIAFSSKIGCEAAGYLLVFGLVNVLNPKWMVVVLFSMSVPAMIVYLAFWHAPERPVATLFEEVELSTNSAQSVNSLEDAEQGHQQVKTLDGVLEKEKYDLRASPSKGYDENGLGPFKAEQDSAFAPRATKESV